MQTKHTVIAVSAVIVMGLATMMVLEKASKAQVVRLPTSLTSINGSYYKYIKRNPAIEVENTSEILKEASSNETEALFEAFIRFGRSIRLDEKISLNTAMHSLMSFGPEHPVYIEGGRKIPILEFIRNYYDYLPPEIKEYSIPWIHRIGEEYFLTISYMPRIISDHLGQLGYVCALAELPIDTTFQLKSGGFVGLEELLETQMKYADPSEHDPTWQTAALAYYWPGKKWKNVNERPFTVLDFLEKTSSHVSGHPTCGHTHALISTAYAIRQLKDRGMLEGQDLARLDKCSNNVEHWVKAVQATLYADGTVSQKWYSNEKVYPKSINELIIYNGHTLEWLAMYLDEESLASEWVLNIARRFCEVAIESIRSKQKEQAWNGDLPFEYAALCHGIRGLRIYCERRVFGF